MMDAKHRISVPLEMIEPDATLVCSEGETAAVIVGILEIDLKLAIVGIEERPVQLLIEKTLDNPGSLCSDQLLT